MRLSLFIFVLSALILTFSSEPPHPRARGFLLGFGGETRYQLVSGETPQGTSWYPAPHRSAQRGWCWGKVFASEVVLRCIPQTGTFKVGDTFTVDYYLDSGGSQTFGAEIIATYDTELLTAVSTNSTVISTETNWRESVTNSIDAALGKIHLDFGSNQTAFSGNSSIGQVIFKAKAAGQAQFNYTFFQPNDNTTPGVAKVWGEPVEGSATNILTNVNNCIYTVEEASSSVTPSPSVPPASSPSLPPVARPTVSELPRSGGREVTIFFLELACLLIFLGIGGVAFTFEP